MYMTSWLFSNERKNLWKALVPTTQETGTVFSDSTKSSEKLLKTMELYFLFSFEALTTDLSFQMPLFSGST